MICPVCESSYITVEKKMYDTHTDEVCHCMDCKHDFAKENAIPYTMVLPTSDDVIGDESR